MAMFENLTSTNPLPALKTGMVLTTDYGGTFMVAKDVAEHCGVTGDIAVRFDEDGEWAGWDTLHSLLANQVIVKVASPYYSVQALDPTVGKDTIWEDRESTPRKMTVSELQEELGYKIEIVEG